MVLLAEAGLAAAPPCRRGLLASVSQATPAEFGLGLGTRLRARERFGLSGLGGRLDQLEVRLRSVVGVEEARLPAVEVGLVADVEEEQALDRGLAVGELDRPCVVRTLDRFRYCIQGTWNPEVRVGAELVE